LAYADGGVKVSVVLQKLLCSHGPAIFDFSVPSGILQHGY
jgi:hypothetical protein